jgi:hypothetical protein
MKFLVFALLGYLGVVADAYCNNSQPIVYGFGNATPFTFPPDNDAICDLYLLLLPLLPSFCSNSYETDEEISYKTFNSTGDEFTDRFTAEDFYNESTLTTFVRLCEELWIVTDYIAQYSAQEGDYKYESKGLCFNSSNLYYSDLDNVRSSFIIGTCHGSEDSVDERLLRLEEDVETTLALAEDRARQLTFVTTSPTLADHLKEAEDLYEDSEDTSDICDPDDCSNNQDVCLELKDCYIDQFENNLFKDFSSLVPDGVDVDSIPNVDEIVSDSFLYSQCFNLTYEELESQKDGICSTTATTPEKGCSPYIILDGSGGCPNGGPSDPVCPWGGYFDSFAPDYPTNYTDYRNAVASIEDLFLCSADGVIDYTDRTSADAVGITLIVKIALQSLQIANEILKDSLPHWFLYYWKIIPYLANAITINIIETILEQTALHDGLVDGAEVEGIYENS